jgi:hypothetical protein
MVAMPVEYFLSEANMISLIKRKLHNNRGDGYVDTAIKFIIFVCLLVTLINGLRMGIQYFELVSYGNNIMQDATSTGIILPDSNYYENYGNNSGLSTDNITITWSAQYYDQLTQRLAFRKAVHLTVYYHTSFAFIFIGNNPALTIPITLPYPTTGYSTIYWKS